MNREELNQQLWDLVYGLLSEREAAEMNERITSDPEVARAYNIVRSKNRAMLNVSVIRNSDNMPVEANVSVKTVNLTGQLKSVSLRKVSEGNPEVDEFVAIYYIGDTTVANRETLMFDIDVTPDGVETPSRVRFQREFYTD